MPLILLAAPFFGIIGAAVYALFLFWPVMILFGALHSQPNFEWVPAIGWETSMFIVALLYLLIPTSNSSSSSD